MADAAQVAFKIEEEGFHEIPATSPGRNEKLAIGFITENSVDKSQGISHSIHKSTHPNTPYSSQGSSWSNSKGKKEV